MSEKASKPRDAGKATKRDDLNKGLMSDGASGAKQPLAEDFYRTYTGHESNALRLFAAAMRGAGGAGGATQRRPLIWLAGDSSLDNKFWLKNTKRTPACNGEERALRFGGGAAELPEDVAHAANTLLAARGLPFGCVNAAIEESTLARRAGGVLLPQDEVLRDQLADGDVIIVSVGGNDIAFQPSLATIMALLRMLGLPCCCLPRLGGASDARLEDGTAPGFAHIAKIFGADTRDFVRALLSGPQRAQPALVIVNMIYHPLEANAGACGGGWADLALSALGYNSNPGRLQIVNRSLFRDATSRIDLGAHIKFVACPLFNVLDPHNPAHYVERVEPSAVGGALMAREFVRLVAKHAQATCAGAGAGAGK